jgi:hypothetical protein
MNISVNISNEYDKYKLYPKEKYEKLLKPHEITNFPLDEFVIINGIEFRMLDDIKIYILENNLSLYDNKEDILDEPYKNQNMSYNDSKHLRDWFFERVNKIGFTKIDNIFNF